ncbi:MULTISPECIES: cation transporter [unclassified Solwaraspora]|uniref:sodium:calcium antiporter n=1 Tax=unclassified Solwaraspora TaxID=2627926 RepID=UPI00248C2D9B|nr:MULTISPECIES: cation transporter [unclassified Solwaraspora]WBB99369.1 cation transporter [Solwaraspora sp. WMMA2059]WBC22081.1 cation transporter [Solwaraspora sp. WMMA2080]WJK35875.1 cation transporter [Solwaraspora sp. WMMA2065]
MPNFVATADWPVTWSIAAFAIAGVVTVVGGIRLVAVGDALADRTGWGEAVFGAVFFGLATSLSGIVMTAVTAVSDAPQLAYSNAVGGIAAQTTAVAVADLFYRRVNLEHAAASLSNLLFGCLLLALLALALLATYTPDGAVVGVHPVSVIMVGCYLGGVMIVHSTDVTPYWQAVDTNETRQDLPQSHGLLDDRPLRRLWVRFALVGLVVAASGWLTALAAESLVQATGLRAGFVGGVLMGLVNALPETITAIAAVRRGAVTLAVAAILGGNCLDALNLVIADIFYRTGSIYHAAGPDELFLTSAALLMTTVLLGGLLARQVRGWGRLGFEGTLLFGGYLAVVAVLAF